MIVYSVTNLINGKKYIGYTTKTLEERKKNHLRKSKNINQKHYFYLFQEALRKYKNEDFKWEILYNCSSKEECQEKEKYFINELNTISPNGYNLTEGGNGGIQSEETKTKISNSLKKYFKENGHNYISKETRSEAAKKSWDTKKKKGYCSPKGFSRSEDSKNKMSETKNKKNSLTWINDLSGEIVDLSCTKMSEKTGLSIGIFSHIKNGRQTITKCGWKLKD